MTIDQARAAVPRRYWPVVFAHVRKTVRYELRIQGGQWVALESDDGGASFVDQKGEVTVAGSNLRLNDSEGFAYSYGWTIQSGALTLKVIQDPSPPFAGVPDRVIQHLIYESHPFTRSA